MKLQQSSLYMAYIEKLGWDHVRVSGVNIIYRNIPFIGRLAKIQRSDKLPDTEKAVMTLKKIGIRMLAIEPDLPVSERDLNIFCRSMSRAGFRNNPNPFLPTKSLIVDISDSETAVFNSFSQTKRRAIRKAIKNQVRVRKSDSIEELINIKKKSAGMFGFITTQGVKEMHEIFKPKYTEILIAESSGSNKTSGQKHLWETLGGVFLIFHNKCAHYWIAGATGHGKKLFAPSLLVWESIRSAKARGCTDFDFVGIWDERLPKGNNAWLGFTRFKLGFGGKPVYYPVFNTKTPY